MADIKVISATLLSGHNTVQVTDPMISDGSIFEIYVSDPHIIYTDVVVGGTTANITFDTKPTANTDIKVLINNASGNLKIPSDNVTDGETTQSAINTSVSNSISTLNSGLSGKVDTTTFNNRVPSDTVLGGVLYHGTTGNEWKVLTGANVNYDSETTVNEKLNECFQSVSSGKSLIASAITDKGVETSSTDTFQTMADNITNIPSGGGSANKVTYYNPTNWSYYSPLWNKYTAQHDGYCVWVGFASSANNYQNCIQSITEDGISISFMKGFMQNGYNQTIYAGFPVTQGKVYQVNTGTQVGFATNSCKYCETYYAQ